MVLRRLSDRGTYVKLLVGRARLHVARRVGYCRVPCPRLRGHVLLPVSSGRKKRGHGTRPFAKQIAQARYLLQRQRRSGATGRRYSGDLCSAERGQSTGLRSTGDPWHPEKAQLQSLRRPANNLFHLRRFFTGLAKCGMRFARDCRLFGHAVAATVDEFQNRRGRHGRSAFQ